MRLQATARYLERHGMPRSPAELREHTLLQWSLRDLVDNQLPLRAGGQVGVQPWVLSPNLQFLLELARTDAGLLFSADLPGSMGGASDLVPVLDSVIGSELQLRALSPRPSRVDPKVRALLENVQRMMSALAQA